MDADTPQGTGDRHVTPMAVNQSSSQGQDGTQVTTEVSTGGGVQKRLRGVDDNSEQKA
jgi:hypothetical protein